MEEATREETTHAAEKGVAEKRAGTDRSDRNRTRGRHISIALNAQEGQMTNIYLPDSDEEAIVNFGKDHEELYVKPTNTLLTRPGRNAFRRGSPTVTSCLSNCARLGSNPKGLSMVNSHSPSLARLQKK